MLMNINDKYELILSTDDFKKMIELYMGYEAAEFFESLVDSANKAISAAKHKTNSDLLYYEASLESNATAFTDIQDELLNISEVLDSNRISRDKIAYSVNKIKMIINNQI